MRLRREDQNLAGPGVVCGPAASAPREPVRNTDLGPDPARNQNLYFNQLPGIHILVTF